MMRFIKIIACALLFCSSITTAAQDKTSSQEPKRPSILFNRWQEDWTVLTTPAVPHQPFDEFKYIPLSKTNPQTYLSLGINLRERFESNDAVSFGTGDSPPQSYVISRFETHADLRIANQLQLFVQLQNDNAPWKTLITPVDKDKLDLEQGFAALVEPIADGTFKFRVGRQQFAFDLQRFVSVRDGPNVRQSYDAIWGDYEHGLWRYISFYSQPVVVRDLHVFDDSSSSHYTFSGFRIERKVNTIGKVNAYIAHYKQDNVRYVSVSGNERRNVLDARIVGLGTSLDWDMEMMGQEGHIANKRIRAWAIGSRSGYTLKQLAWEPRIGFQVDAASGNRSHYGNTLGTFNPLFPNGYYFTLAGYTGYSNLIHVKPSFSVKPNSSLTAMIAAAALWRETTDDAIYTQPLNPVPGSAGTGGPFTGNYYQIRFDWLISNHLVSALEFVHFQIADALEAIGAQNSDYVGVELKFGW